MSSSSIDTESVASVGRRLEHDGYVWLTAPALGVEGLARGLGTIRSHRDATPSGATRIRARHDRISAGAAFTRAALPPHTDGSGVVHPADIVVNECVRAGCGGNVLLVDGQLVLRALAEDRSDVVGLLRAPLYTFGEARIRAPILSRHPARGTEAIRYRNDGLLSPVDRAAWRALQVLDRYIQMHVRSLTLTEGDGYIVDNTRFLHGRTTFSGDREVVRYLVDSPDLRLGIRPTAATATSTEGDQHESLAP